MQLRVVVLVVGLAILGARIAAADDGGPDVMYSPGVLIGAASNSRGHLTDFILGGEISVFRVKDWTTWQSGNGAPMVAPGMPFPNMGWLGGYVDGEYDFATRTGRITLGPELGWDFLGLDGGLAVERAPGKTNVGYALRGVITLGFVQGFERVEVFGDGSAQLEAGVLVKRPKDLHRWVHRK